MNTQTLIDSINKRMAELKAEGIQAADRAAREAADPYNQRIDELARILAQLDEQNATAPGDESGVG